MISMKAVSPHLWGGFYMVIGGGVQGVVSRGVRTFHEGDVRVKLAP